MKPLDLTKKQLAYAAENYRPGIPGKGAATIARALGVSRDGLLRNINPSYRAKRNGEAAASMRKNRTPTGYRPGPRSRPVTLPTLACLTSAGD